MHARLNHNQTPVHNNMRINLPDGSSIAATHKGTIPIHQHLPSAAQLAYILPHLTNEWLLTVGQFCDYDCDVLFRKRACYIAWNNQIILQGLRNRFDGLWDITLPTIKATLSTQQPTFQLNYIVKNDQTKTELAQYIHAAMFSPCIKTLQQAIYNGNLLSWPVEHLNFVKLIRTTIATEKGNLDQERKHLQSTSTPEDLLHNFPSKLEDKTHSQFAQIVSPLLELTPLKQKAYADLTGQFPHKSSRGNQYLFVLYNYDTNAILFEPLKTRQSNEITNAYDKCYAKLAKNLTAPKLYILDNECSADLKLAIIKKNAKYELVPPHQHRRNAAEKAIRTLKNHLLSGLATCDNQFPIHEWDCLLPQCELTLNLLRNS